MKRVCFGWGLALVLALGLAAGCESESTDAQPGVSQDAEADLAASDLTGAPELPDDALVNADLSPPNDCEPGTGCFGEPCDDGADCLSGYCGVHLGDRVCTRTCEDSCPTGWVCALIQSSGTDGVYLCLSNHGRLCQPCATSSDCSEGSVSEACVHYPDEGSFCGAICDAEAPCPEGFICQERESVEGGTSAQCAAEEGVCPCSQTAISLGLATPCDLTNEAGTCAGHRQCGAEGLEPCDAKLPEPESCNGIDDDCDGETDEETCEDDEACTADACDPVEGCEHQPLDAVPCDDGDACTTSDQCAAGSCGGELVTCDDGNPCTEDLCDGVFGCTFPDVQADCSDGDPCTVGDHCVDGACTSGPSLLCDDQNPCTEDACDEVLGCAHTPTTDPCDDQNACTSGDTCVEGACLPSAPVDCDDQNACTTDVCHPESGCANTPNDQACDDTDPCTLGDHCADAGCVGGAESLPCDDGNPCTDDACVAGLGCAFTPNDEPCDDQNACTIGDQCVDGACAAGVVILCDDEDLCTHDHCDAATGCQSTPNQAPCDDGDLCSLGDHCDDGACDPGPGALVCDDGNLCTDDACDALSGCVFSPNDGPCDDQNFCTTGDHCSLGSCVGDGSLACDDGNSCTLDLCLPGGGCQHEPIEGPCSDGDPCTVGDACVAGACEPGAAQICDDQNPCTTDLCTAEGVCDHAPGAGPCSDGNTCSLGDHCEGGQCVPDSSLDCDDQNPCTSDSCIPESGCAHAINDEAPCQDGDVCTVGDQCADGGCVGGAGLVCSDGNPCTDDSCDGDAGCVFSPNEEDCDDQNACSTQDICSEGVCVSGAAVGCDDGDWCNGLESCDSELGCLAGVDEEVDDGVSCTEDLCDEATDAFVHLPDDDQCPAGGLCEVPKCDLTSGCSVVTESDCCGNGQVEDGEECDDGNATPGDGCGPSCVVTVGEEEDPGLSCRAILDGGGSDGDGVYWIEPDPEYAPFQARCDMTRDGGGWTLVAKVHRATSGGVSEPNTWFTQGNNPDLLIVEGEHTNESPSGFGTTRFMERINGLTHVARFDLHAEGDFDTRVSWFKGAEPGAFERWFVDDDQPTPVCLDPALTAVCVEGVIKSQGTTALGGMLLSDHGYIGGEIHMRQDSDISGSTFSAVCSSSSNGAWPDSAIDGQWGNPLRIWIKESLCGDGQVEAGETCDDGNEANGDGCSAACAVELSGKDCVEIHTLHPEHPSGTYGIDPDENGEDILAVHCDMDTDGGGWTRIFLAGTSQYSATSIDYTVADATLREEASDALIAYTNASDAIVGSHARIRFPSPWIAKAPMQHVKEDISVETHVDGVSVGNRTVRYGTCDYQSPCCADWGGCSANWLHGRVCICDTEAPYWGFWSGPDPTYGDACGTSDVNVGSEPCSADRRFSILVRRAICGNGVEEVGEECDDGNGVDGDGCSAQCETPPVGTESNPASSCLEIRDEGDSTGDGVYFVDFDGAGGEAALTVYCDMTQHGGGWTLVLMTKNGDHETFKYESSHWTSGGEVNGDTLNPATDDNMKSLAYSKLSLSELRLDLVDVGNAHIISVSASSAQEVFSGAFIGTPYSREDFLNWVPDDNSNWNNQTCCNTRGFNPQESQSRCRYGIIMNNECNECQSADSAVGFGCYTNDNCCPSVRRISSGAFRWSPDVRYSHRGWIWAR